MSALGSLVVKLALEYAQYTQGLNKSEQQTLAHAKRVQDAYDGIQNKVNSVARNVGATLAAGLGVAALTGLIATAVRTGESLHDLSIQTGATVEALSGLASVGKTTSTSAEQIANNMTRLARNLAGAKEEGKGTGKALQALGIDFDNFKKLKPEEQMMTVAKAMERYADGNGKAAVAQALYGKEGAKSLPFMKDLALVGGLQAKTTEAQAAASDSLRDNMVKLRASSESWKKELAQGMIPALNEGLQAFIDITNGTGGLRAEIRQLSKDGTITEWTRNVIMGVSYVIDGFVGVKRVVQSAGEYIGAAAAGSVALFTSMADAFWKVNHFDFSGAAAAVRNGVAQQKAIWGSLGSTLDDVWGESTLGAKLRARMADLKAMGTVAVVARKQIDFDNTKDEKEKADPQVKAYKDLVAAIHEKIAANNLEAEGGKALTEQQKVSIQIDKLFEAGQISAEDATSLQTAALLEQLGASEKASDAAKAFTKSLEDNAVAYGKLLDAAGQDVDKQRDQIRQQRDHNDAIGQSKEVIAELAAVKLEETAVSKDRLAVLWQDIDLTGQMSQRLREQADDYRELAKLKRQGGTKEKEIEDFKNVWQSIDRTAHDVFTNIFEGGKNAFTKLRDTLKGTLLDLLYQMTVRKWIFNIVGNVTGQSSGVMGAVGQAAGIGQGIGGVGNLASGASVLGSMGSAFSTGLSTGIGANGLAVSGATLVGETGLMAASGGSVMAGMGAAVQAGLAAIGPIGWMALAAIAAYAIFSGGGGGPKTEAGFSPSGLNIGGKDVGGNMQGSERGDVAAARTVSQSISAGYADLTAKLGLVEKKLDVGLFYSMDNAEGGTSLTQLQVTSSAGYNRGTRAGGIENVARGDEALKAALAEETVRVMFDALKQSDLPAQYKAFLNVVAADAGAAEMQAAIDKVVAVKTQRAQLEATLLDLTSTDLEKLNRLRTAERAAIDPMNAALVESIYAAQDAKTAATELAQAQEAQRQAATAAAAAITAAQDSAMAAVERAINAERTRTQAVVDAAQERVQALDNVFQILGTSVRELYGEVSSTQQMSARDGQAFIAQALQTANSTGYMPDAEQLGQAINAARGGLKEANYATKADFDRDRLVLAGNLDQLKGKAGGQLTAAQQMLDAADKQLQALDDQLAIAKDLLDVERGVDKSVLSVVDAVDRLTALLSPAKAANAAKPAAGSSPSFAGIQNVGGGPAVTPYTGDPGYAYQGGLAPSQYFADLQGTWNDPRGNNWTPPAFASGGVHGGGLAIVGERGPELVDMAPSRIFSSGRTEDLLGAGSSDVVAVLNKLIGKIDLLRTETQAVAIHGKGTLDLLTRVTENGDAMLTRAAP